jgi:hypothetical protein
MCRLCSSELAKVREVLMAKCSPEYSKEGFSAELRVLDVGLLCWRD